MKKSSFGNKRPTKAQPVRDPNWRARRELGHRVVKLATRYNRKVKHWLAWPC